MKTNFEKIEHSPLFAGIRYSDFEGIFKCIDARTQKYNRNDIILLSGDAVSYVGLILSGCVKIIKEDADGKAAILTDIGTAELFGEAFVCAGIERSPVTVQASEKSEILFFNYKKIITTCSSACGVHSKLIENMLRLIARKNLMLNQKIEILSKRTTRDKLLLLFDIQRGTAKKFTMPYNREEMAHYLCVDRSAMSKELCRMRDEGIISFSKNEFEVL